MKRVATFLTNLVRRKVFRALGAYLVAVWALAQGVASLHDTLGLPDWGVKVILTVGLIGIPLVTYLSWRFDVKLRFVPDPTDGRVGECPQSLRDADAEREWARHDAAGAGHITASWVREDGTTEAKQFHAPFVIGRDVVNDICLTNDRVSRRHVLIWAEEGAWRVKDLGSSNGTFVDGKRIASMALHAPTTLRLHPTGPAVVLSVESLPETMVTSKNSTRPPSGR